MKTRRAAWAGALGLLLLAPPPGCGGPEGVAAPPAAGAGSGRVALVESPDGGIQPQAVVDARGDLHLLAFKGDPAAGDLWYARRARGQERFSAPLRVNSQGGSAVAVGTIRGGQLAVGKNGRVHVAWNGSGRAQPAGPGGGSPMLYSRMNAAGSGFEPQRNLMQFTTFLDGGGTVAADPKGNVYVAWHGGDGVRTGEESRRLWVARSHDDGATFDREAPAFAEPTGACACCGTKALATAGGELFLLYRSATRKVDRDIYLLASRDRGQQFSGTRVDRWRIAACPMSSEALVASPAGVLAAWETNGQVFFGRIDPAGVKVPSPIPAPGMGDNRKHPTLAVNAAGQVLLAWTEGTGWQRGGALAWQLFDRAGKPAAEMGRVAGAIPVWGMAAAVARPDGGFLILH